MLKQRRSQLLAKAFMKFSFSVLPLNVLTIVDFTAAEYLLMASATATATVTVTVTVKKN